MSLKVANEKKLRLIVNYFDGHKLVALGLPVKPYFLLDSNTVESIYTKLAEEIAEEWYPEIKKSVIKNIKDFGIEYFQEVVFRNVAGGYYFRIAEKLVLSKKFGNAQKKHCPTNY